VVAETDTIREYRPVIERLCAAFPAVPADVVQRTLVMGVDCARHLQIAVTPALIESLVTDCLQHRARALPLSREETVLHHQLDSRVARLPLLPPAGSRSGGRPSDPEGLALGVQAGAEFGDRLVAGVVCCHLVKGWPLGIARLGGKLCTHRQA
jgi:hypothetical protein